MRKTDALRLASDAKRDGALVFRGRLVRAEDGRLMLGDRDLLSLFATAEGAETLVVVAAIEESASAHIKVCGTCGREYEGVECPHCSSARRRLRGS